MSGWQITVHGVPAPQGSKDQFGRESSKKVKPWREAVRSEAQDAIEAGAQPIVGPVSVEVTFWLPRPKSHYRTGRHAGELKPDAPMWVDKRPDLDKLVRSTLDALTAAGAYADDASVAHLYAAKVYAPHGTHIGAVILLRPVHR